MLYLEMIAKGLILMKIRGDHGDYWSLMDIFGNVLPFPEKLTEAFRANF